MTYAKSSYKKKITALVPPKKWYFFPFRFQRLTSTAPDDDPKASGPFFSVDIELNIPNVVSALCVEKKMMVVLRAEKDYGSALCRKKEDGSAL